MYFFGWDLEAASNASQEMATPFAPGAGAPQQPGQALDYNKLFAAERDNLEFSQGLYSWIGDDVETRVLRKYGKVAT
jgi:ER membrane protein complex subunit 3